MAVEDIRVKLSFKGHRKRRKLRKLLGPSYLDHLLDIWLTAAEERINGELCGWDDEDLVWAASATVPYKGNANKLRQALLESGFLENNGGVSLKIHNWEKHQEWVIKTDDRKAKGKFARMVQQVKKDFCKPCSGHYSESDAESCPESCPLKGGGLCPFLATGTTPAPFLLPTYSLPAPYLTLPTHFSKETPYNPPLEGGSNKNNGFKNIVKLRCNGCSKEREITVIESVVKHLEKTGNTNIPALKIPCEHCEQVAGYEYMGAYDVCKT